MTPLLIKKSIFNIRMLVVTLLSFTILFASLITNGTLSHGINNLRDSYDLLLLYTIPFAYSSFVIFAGLFPGVPYAYSYLEERNSGYLKFIQLRLPRNRYIRQKIFYSGLSGGLSMLIPGVLIFIIIDFLSMDTSPMNHATIFEQLIWAPYIYIWGGRFVLLLKAILLFLFGVMWSELSLFISQIFKNKYVAYILPFLLYQACWVLDIIDGSFNPVYLVRSDWEAGNPIYAPFLILIGYIVLFICLNIITFKRQGRK